MDRRQFLNVSAAGVIAAAVPPVARAAPAAALEPPSRSGPWRMFDVTDLARKTLFGAWEMNWMGFNTAGDTRLAPETAKSLGHFMYPYAETAKGALDYYDAQNFQYRMSSRELPV